MDWIGKRETNYGRVELQRTQEYCNRILHLWISPAGPSTESGGSLRLQMTNEWFKGIVQQQGMSPKKYAEKAAGKSLASIYSTG
jgi:hypothetical protein